MNYTKRQAKAAAPLRHLPRFRLVARALEAKATKSGAFERISARRVRVMSSAVLRMRIVGVRPEGLG